MYASRSQHKLDVESWWNVAWDGVVLASVCHAQQLFFYHEWAIARSQENLLLLCWQILDLVGHSGSSYNSWVHDAGALQGRSGSSPTFRNCTLSDTSEHFQATVCYSLAMSWSSTSWTLVKVRVSCCHDKCCFIQQTTGVMSVGGSKSCNAINGKCCGPSAQTIMSFVLISFKNTPPNQTNFNNRLAQETIGKVF